MVLTITRPELVTGHLLGEVRHQLGRLLADGGGHDVAHLQRHRPGGGHHAPSSRHWGYWVIMHNVFSPVTLHLALLEAAARGPRTDPHGDPLAGPRPAAEGLVVHPALPLLPRGGGGGGLASLQTPGPRLQQGRGLQRLQ